MKYQDLERLQRNWHGKTCIFGAGLIGRTWGYDIISSAGFDIDYYYDNKLDAGIEIRDEIKTVDFNLLYRIKDEVLFFITVAEKFHEEIINQLKEAGIKNYVIIGFLFLQEFCESVLDSQNDKVIEKYKKIVDDKEFLKGQFLYRCGYELNIDNPRTFNEKLQWLKLNDRRMEYVNLVDKYEFKKYVKKEIGEEYIIPTIAVWDKVEEIEWEKLSNQFVLKCTHDSGSVVICKDKNKFDFNQAKKKLARALKRNYYWYGREWPYKEIVPRIIAEMYMEDMETCDLNDYKVFCFNGKAKIIQVDFDRFVNHRRNIYNLQWEYISVQIKYKTDPNIKIKKPYCLEKLIQIAEKLSKNIPYVRVDFYVIENKIYVGEMTFYHGAGYEKFSDYKFELELGHYIV